MSLLNDLSKEWPHPDDFEKIINEIESSNDRGAALSMSAYIDNLLILCIKSNFISLGKDYEDKIFNGNGPLSSLSAKITIGYALGIYNGEYRSQMDRIRTIRNAFAHSIKPLYFTNNIISSECMKLNPSALVVQKVNDGGIPKGRFLASCFIIMSLLGEYLMAIHIEKVNNLPKPFLGKSAQQGFPPAQNPDDKNE